MVRVPILVDLEEHPADFGVPASRKVVFSGAAAYDQTICFAVQAMAAVWDRYPDCELCITGASAGTTQYTKLEQQIVALQPKGPVRLAGLLRRQDLLQLYQQASALLIPLFADVRSIARFPTKIGEYLASGRPVVTNCVGEIPLFLHDGSNACVVAPGDPALYGARILRLIENPTWASELGRSGWETARQHFDFRGYGPRLLAFFQQLCVRRDPVW
jgi:glycosyltransferase involved in cell wall biosynthesis